MNFNPIEMQKHLKGVSYPASKGDLVDQLRNADRDQFSGPDDVREALERS